MDLQPTTRSQPHKHRSRRNLLIGTVTGLILSIPFWPAASHTRLQWALVSACKRDDAAAVHSLILQGASPDAVAPFHIAWDKLPRSLTPLMIATEHGSAQAIGALIQEGATINDPDGAGELLYWSLFFRDPESTRALLDAGVSPAHDTPRSSHLVHIAIDSRRVDLAILLIMHGGNIGPSHQSPYSVIDCIQLQMPAADCLALVRSLLSRGLDPNVVLQWGPKRPLLHWACLHGDPELVSLLIAHGADPTLKDEHGQTADNLAARRTDGLAAEIHGRLTSPR